MNIHHLRCAVTVARLGSQTRAAEALYMSQPNLSKALKELEQLCGFRIFERTGTGMVPTRKGEMFLARARSILEQMDALDAIYQGHNRTTANLSVAIPRAGYITHALTEYVNALDAHDGMELTVRETNMQEIIRALLGREAGVGIVRYSVDKQNMILESLSEQGLHYVLYWTFRHVAVLSRRHPLAQQKRLEKGALLPYIELVGDDALPPSGFQTAALEGTAVSRRQIQAHECSGQLDFLSRSPSTYMWSSPMPEEMLDRYGLIQLESDENIPQYQDALVFIKGYTLSRWEQQFYDLVRQEAERLG